MKNALLTNLGTICLLVAGCGGVAPELPADQLATASMAITERDLPGCEVPNLALGTRQLEILRHPLDPMLRVLQRRGEALCIDTADVITQHINHFVIASPSTYSASYIADPVEDDPHPLTRNSEGKADSAAPEDDPHPLTNSATPTSNPNAVHNGAPEDDPHPLTRSASRPPSGEDEIIHRPAYASIK